MKKTNIDSAQITYDRLLRYDDWPDQIELEKREELRQRFVKENRKIIIDAAIERNESAFFNFCDYIKSFDSEACPDDVFEAIQTLLSQSAYRIFAERRKPFNIIFEAMLQQQAKKMAIDEINDLELSHE